MLNIRTLPMVLAVAALAVIASFLVEASVGAPTYAYLFSAVGAILLIVALILSLRGGSTR